MFTTLHLQLYLLAQLNGSGRRLRLAGTRRNRWLLDGMRFEITNRLFLGSSRVLSCRGWLNLYKAEMLSPSCRDLPASLYFISSSPYLHPCNLRALSHRESPRLITAFQNGQRPTPFHNGECLHQEGLPRCVPSRRPEVTGTFASW
jgi:hypothetical protein